MTQRRITKNAPKALRKNHRKRFAHKLALELGRSVGWVLRLPQSEFEDWVAYYSIDPFGNERADIHAGQIVQAIASLFTKHPKPLSEFVLKFSRENSVEELEAKLAMFAAMHAKPK